MSGDDDDLLMLASDAQWRLRAVADQLEADLKQRIAVVLRGAAKDDPELARTALRREIQAALLNFEQRLYLLHQTGHA